jgi:hypothetical protein
MEGCCDNSNELFGSIKGREFVDQLNDREISGSLGSK